MEKLFYREPNKNLDQNYLSFLNTKINVNNVFHLSSKKIINLFDKKYEAEYLFHRFAILNKWIELNYQLSRTYLENLEKIIKILHLENFLTTKEKNHILYLKSYIFTSNRNIKTLIVDFPLNKDENIYFHYDQIKLWYVNKNKKELVKNIFEVYFGDQRFVFSNQLNIIYFKISNIKEIKFAPNEIIFIFDNFQYILVSEDINILIMSIKRLFKIIKLGELWEVN